MKTYFARAIIFKNLKDEGNTLKEIATICNVTTDFVYRAIRALSSSKTDKDLFLEEVINYNEFVKRIHINGR